MDIMQQINIHVIGIPEEERESENLFKEIMT